MPGTDLRLLIEAAYTAGEIATRFVGGPLGVSHKPDGAGPVTDADHAVNEALADLLRNARPEYGWLSEETPDDPVRLGQERVFIVDPIDGTRSFIDGSNTWAHSIALAEQGTVVAAVVYLPMRDKMYVAERGSGARLNDAPLRPSDRPSLTDAEVLTTKPSLDPKHWTTLPAFNRSHRPSLAYRMCLVAEGRFDAMFTFRPSWEWDIAAGALILEEAGAQVTDKTGDALRFNNPTPQTNGVIAANPALVDDTLRRLRPSQPQLL